jgi:hypothetical protein
MKAMYNNEVKTRFMEQLRTDSLMKQYKSIFSRTTEYENEYNKDAAQLTPDECMNLIAALNPKSLGHASSLISQFASYTQWAMDTGIVARNSWVLIDVDDDFVKHSFLRRNVKDLEELTHIVDVGLSVPYDKYVVYLLYMGVMGDDFSELVLIKDDDVNKSERTITTIRRTYTDIIEPFFALINKHDSYEEQRKRDYDSPYFVKPYNTKRLQGNPINYQAVHRVFRKLNSTFNQAYPENQKEYTPTTIWRSGFYNALYNIEQQKGGLVADDFAYLSEIYDNKNSYSSYTRDYELYKLLFWEQ